MKPENQRRWCYRSGDTEQRAQSGAITGDVSAASAQAPTKNGAAVENSAPNTAATPQRIHASFDGFSATVNVACMSRIAHSQSNPYDLASAE